MARRRGYAAATGRWRLRLAALLLLVALIGGVWGWWHLRHWTPERGAYPVQGIEGGTTEILKNIVAERVLGLPRK